MNSIRDRSGNVEDDRKLVAFIYTILRDEISPGRVEEIIQDIENHPPPYGFSNGWLANYAKDITNRLEGG